MRGRSQSLEEEINSTLPPSQEEAVVLRPPRIQCLFQILVEDRSILHTRRPELFCLGES